MKKIALLGSTGSIGLSTLDVVAEHPRRFCVDAIAANRNVTTLYEQIKAFQPKLVAVADEQSAKLLIKKCQRLKKKPKIVSGMDGVRLVAVYPTTSIVVSAIVGNAGLLPTLDAIKAGKDIALANKETLVTAGDIVMKAAKRHGVKLLPVDSEHAALAQCLQGHKGTPVSRLILTASGGPFINTSMEKLKQVTLKDALNHPTWAMGQKITIDSASLMNKGLEVIEAHHLFDVPYENIEVVVHPQSIVHSMVEFVDGSTLAQLSNPDMRLPIQTALTDPERIGSLLKPLDFSKGLNLSFGPPDLRRFPCLKLAYQAGRLGGIAPVVLNAANEIAVQALLDQKINFMMVPKIIERILKKRNHETKMNLNIIQAADRWARLAAEEEVKKCKR